MINGFPKRLKELRLEKKISQTELGKLVGVHYTHIGRYEMGKSTPKSNTLKKLAGALGVTTDYLFEGKIDEVAEERLEDHNMLRLFKEVEKLNDQDKIIIRELIEAFITKRNIQSMVK
jgi:transcriptional regulator with XRE-family HTH domain